MRRIILFLLCSGLIIGTVVCGGNTAPTTTVTEKPKEGTKPTETTKANGKWYVCICMSEKNYGG